MNIAAANIASPQPTKPPENPELRKVIGQTVGSVFFGTLLSTMRNSGMKGKYGHGGRGEEAFTGQLHGVLAERMGTRLNNSLSKALYNRYARQVELMSEVRKSATPSGVLGE